jgi:hypothetical protein
MDPDVVAGFVGDALEVVSLILPMVPGGTAAAPVIAFLTKAMPAIEQAVKAAPEIYTGVKNLITALKADPSTLPAQLEALQKLDTIVDGAFDAADDDADLAGQI